MNNLVSRFRVSLWGIVLSVLLAGTVHARTLLLNGQNAANLTSITWLTREGLAGAAGRDGRSRGKPLALHYDREL